MAYCCGGRLEEKTHEFLQIKMSLSKLEKGDFQVLKRKLTEIRKDESSERRIHKVCDDHNYCSMFGEAKKSRKSTRVCSANGCKITNKERTMFTFPGIYKTERGKVVMSPENLNR